MPRHSVRRTPTPYNAPRMFRAVAYVAAHPDCPILPVAEAVAPHGSRRFGYAIVHRAIRAGLLSAVRGANGRYSLRVRA